MLCQCLLFIYIYLITFFLILYFFSPLSFDFVPMLFCYYFAI
uniref:Uncharacterized protein n=1 Tax=Chondria sp. (in: red algae) TaxID=1982705 RepID=A0A1Z1MQW8_9FLOR|nr:hypothetical protein [Chondria sp. (in: red algae)]